MIDASKNQGGSSISVRARAPSLRLAELAEQLAESVAASSWPELLADLLAWNQEGRPTQQKWARDFNRTVKEGDQRFQGLGKS
jgi:hypothetical protein